MMRFGIYSEMQHWPGKSAGRLYAEVAEQVVHADRLGYWSYAIVEHLFFPRFSISPDPLSFFCQVAPRTRQIRFRTMLHVLPYHNPTVLASRIAEAEILLEGRYEFGVGRGHGWIPPKAGIRLSDGPGRPCQKTGRQTHARRRARQTMPREVRDDR
jgi:alkanesulfonate monooxygenase SsuD/methylene tetrahydromethanopterin reductase-like flavin-dependent oxidoreductase (luciferase family)